MTGVDPDCKYSSNPYHECNEYCNKIKTERKKPSSKNKERLPDCRYLSNPYHECNEYCFKLITGSKKPASKNEPDRLKADTRRSFQPTDDEKSDEWKRLFGEIVKLNQRFEQLERHQNEDRKEEERMHREIMQRLDFLQQKSPRQHYSLAYLLCWPEEF